MPNSIKGRVFLVTGCAVFIGSFVTEELLKRGAIVFGIDNLDTGKIENINHLLKNPHLKFKKTSILTRNVMEKLINEVDYIYHAAVRSIGGSTDNPMLDLDVNIKGTLLILDLMKKSKVKRLVFASSASVYGNATIFPEKETHITYPLSPYGVSKLAAEHYAITYYHLYDLPVVALRYFNVYGPRQRWDSYYGGVVSIFLYNTLQGKPLTIYGTGNQTRDFTYIEDAVEATINSFFAKGVVGKVINISGGREYSIKHLAKVVKNISGNKLPIKYIKKRLIDNVNRRFGDIALAKKLLNYHPSCTLEEGLKKTYQWWKQHQ